jgi:hypothetical protein
MSRITDTERGARIAQDAAAAVLGILNANANPAQLHLFKRRRLSKAERQLWSSILDAAADAIADEAALREALNG